MTGQELAAWRLEQPGQHRFKNNQVRPGWSQKMAAEWFGTTERTWRRWEAMDEIPKRVELAVRRHVSRLSDIAEGLGLKE